MKVTLEAPNPTSVKSFWLVASVLFGLSLTAILAILGRGGPELAGAPAAALGLYAAGRLRPSMADWIYRAWNWLALRLSRLASGVALGLAFGVVAAAGGSARVLLRKPQAGASMWLRREPIDPATYPSEFVGPGAGSGRIGSYISWALRSGNGWTVALLPFLLFLSALEVQRKAPAPADIYTLF